MFGQGHAERPFLAIGRPENIDKAEEEVENIKIQRNRSPYVLVVAEALDQVAGVIYDVGGEHDRSQAAMYHRG